jgi:putative sterol carrier protein
MAQFPSADWLQTLMDKLNGDERYAQIARNWEGDMTCVIEPGGALQEQISFYLDLWHGKCRRVLVLDGSEEIKPLLVLRGPYENYVRIFKGELDPLQAMMTRKIGVQGSMALLMRSVPTVLDFVRCCREVTDSFV